MLRVRFQILRKERTIFIRKYQSCMVSKLRIIWKRTRTELAVVGVNHGIRPLTVQIDVPSPLDKYRERVVFAKPFKRLGFTLRF